MTTSIHNFEFDRFSIIGVFLILSASFAIAQEIMDNNVLMGWAVVPKFGAENTIGGHDGKVVTAKTSAEQREYAKSKEPLAIIADRQLDYWNHTSQ